MSKTPIPIVDLFAGPGGLGEGFSRVDGGKAFKIIVSIEKDPHAIQTLRLRAFYRAWVKSEEKLPKAYFDLLSAKNEKEKTHAIAQLSELKEWKMAQDEALHLELGEHNLLIHAEIQKRLGEEKKWVLIGGPPCQAYSLVGRSRMQNHKGLKADDRHFLYREYLTVIEKFEPAIFVMENVKGLNTARVAGRPILPLILNDLRNAGIHGYELHSLEVEDGTLPSVTTDDFLIRAENHGIPQTRHRVIIVGVRKDMQIKPQPLALKKMVTVKQIISDLPTLMGLDSSKNLDSYGPEKTGLPMIQVSGLRSKLPDSFKDLRDFLSPLSPSLKRFILNHQARSHMLEDLKRYKWWAEQAEKNDRSPKLNDDNIPHKLLPKHENVTDGSALVFADRFKVQLANSPSGTITSHIAKDGHYYIHYDPRQCRTFSVREAARIQTFPDDYLFMGNKTQQYQQVGNAVPPYLAYQIGQRVYEALHP